MRTDQPTSSHISLFTGAGGLDLGLEEAGFVTRVCVEVDRDCQSTLERNRRFRGDQNFTLLGDLNSTPPSAILAAAGLRPYEATLISGGPPCQSYSTAGKRGSINDPRGQLFFKFADVIEEAKPRFFIMKNYGAYCPRRFYTGRLN